MTTTQSKIQVDVTHEETMAWRRKIIVEHEGISYRVDLFWDLHEGFESWWHDMDRNLIDMPDWALSWEDVNQGRYQSFNGYLDEITFEKVQS